MQFAFRVYDVDGDGYVSPSDLREVLRMMVGTNLNEAQLQHIVEKTVAEHDADKDGRLSPAEFAKVSVLSWFWFGASLMVRCRSLSSQIFRTDLR